MIGPILNFVMWVAGLFGLGKPKDDASIQRDEAHKAGVDEAGRAAAEGEVHELEAAIQARQDSQKQNAGGEQAIRDRAATDPNARPWNPDANG